MTRAPLSRLPWLLGAALALAACGDPLQDVPRLDEVPVAQDAGTAEAVPDAAAEDVLPEAQVATDPQPRTGLLGLFQRRATAATTAASPETDAPEADVEAAPEVVAAAEEVLGDTQEVAALAPTNTPEPRQRRGLGALFGGGSARDDGANAASAPTSSGTGLSQDAPDFRQVTLGTALPYGEIARVCDVRPQQLGSEVQSYPERGNAYTLYDSAPGSMALRTFYLTGFNDRCARQFTAALVLFGDPETYEQIHYGAPAKNQPTAMTDRAYEEVKNRFCRARDGQPCGNRMKALKRTTVFVNVYERFESNPRWKNILLHDGAVVAMDVKS